MSEQANTAETKLNELSNAINKLFDVVIPFMEAAEPGKKLFFPIREDISFHFQRTDKTIILRMKWGKRILSGERLIGL